jgi:hypothetical protein
MKTIYSNVTQNKILKIMYVKCDNFGCRAVGITGSNFILKRTLSNYSDMKEQIEQLLLAEKKRAADKPLGSLRDIFDEECCHGDGASHSLSFGSTESPMYKRRWLNQPSLPRTVDD